MQCAVTHSSSGLAYKRTGLCTVPTTECSLFLRHFEMAAHLPAISTVEAGQSPEEAAHDVDRMHNSDHHFAADHRCPAAWTCAVPDHVHDHEQCSSMPYTKACQQLKEFHQDSYAGNSKSLEYPGELMSIVLNAGACLLLSCMHGVMLVQMPMTLRILWPVSLATALANGCKPPLE